MCKGLISSGMGYVYVNRDKPELRLFHDHADIVIKYFHIRVKTSWVRISIFFMRMKKKRFYFAQRNVNNKYSGDYQFLFTSSYE